MWEIHDGIVRIAKTYFGKNGRALGTPDGLDPFTQDELTKGVLTVNDYPGEKIIIKEDWIILDRAGFAYNKNGTIAFLDSTRDPSGINTKYPYAVKYDDTITYIFYAIPTTNGFQFSKYPRENSIYIQSHYPESDLDAIKIIMKYTNTIPKEVFEGNVYIDGSDKPVFSNGEFIISQSKPIKINYKHLKIGEIDFSKGREFIEYAPGITIEYVWGTPASIEYSVDGVTATVDRKDEPTESFMEIARELSKIKVVPGKAPYRAEVYSMWYEACAKINDRIIKFTIPYGYTLDGVSFVRCKAQVPNYKKDERTIEKYVYQGIHPLIVRVFNVGSPLLKIKGEYYIGNTCIGKAKNPYDALTKYRELLELKNKEIEHKPEPKYEEVKLIEVCTVDPYGVESCQKYLDTPGNREKISKIVAEIKRQYELVPIKAMPGESTGIGMVSRIAVNKAKELAEVIEKIMPGIFWKFDDGEWIINGIETTFDIDEKLNEYIYEYAPDVPLKYQYYSMLERKYGLKRMKTRTETIEI